MYSLNGVKKRVCKTVIAEIRFGTSFLLLNQVMVYLFFFI